MKERLVVLCVAALLGAGIGWGMVGFPSISWRVNTPQEDPAWEPNEIVDLSDETLWEIREIAKELP